MTVRLSPALSVGQEPGNETVAEGVETEDQREILQELGCDNYQGYLYSKPLPAKLFARKFLSGEKVI